MFTLPLGIDTFSHVFWFRQEFQSLNRLKTKKPQTKKTPNLLNIGAKDWCKKFLWTLVVFEVLRHCTSHLQNCYLAGATAESLVQHLHIYEFSPFDNTFPAISVWGRRFRCPFKGKDPCLFSGPSFQVVIGTFWKDFRMRLLTFGI